MPRLADNVAAMRLVKDLQTDNRYATPAEQDVLAKYVGWGATKLAEYLSEAPDEDWSANEKNLWQELQSLTTKEQREYLRRSSPNAHFTYDLYQPIWNALARFGFTGGRILEPSVGTGHALGFMDPTVRKNSTITATELEPITAAIASYLYPSARVQATGFQSIRLPRNTQDLAISNVPFGKFGIVDKLFSGNLNFITRKLHSYFFAKALEYVRPGGYIVFVTSRYTMDGPEHAEIRRYLMTKAHFVGAVRFPGGKQGAFVKSAKTQVVTDLIVLQKFAAGQTEAQNANEFLASPIVDAFSIPEKTIGEGKKKRTIPASNVYRSAWYTANPQYVLGTEGTTGTQHKANEYAVERRAGEDLHSAIEQALGAILPEGGYTAARPSATPDPKVVEDAFKPGELRAGSDRKTIERVLRTGEVVDATPKLKNGQVDEVQLNRTLGLIGVRDARRAVVAAMRSQTSTNEEIEQAQALLQQFYDTFVDTHGSLNSRENVAAFKADPEAETLRALEVLKTTTKTVIGKTGKKRLVVQHEVIRLADIFTKRTINVTPDISHVDTPQDALMASLGTRAAIDWAYMARITGDGEATPERITQLQQTLREAGAIFEQPDGAWVIRDEYLSGDVVSKLADASAAAEADDEPERYQRNVDALRAVQPEPKTAAQVTVTLGAHWVDPADVAQFITSTLGQEGTELRLDGAEQYVRWTGNYPANVVHAGDRHRWAVKYGNPDNPVAKVFGFTDLVDAALNLKTIELGYTIRLADGSSQRIKQPEQTLAARANVEEVRALFSTWMYGNRAVLSRTVDTYNARFNRTVRRTYDGSHLANYRNDKGEPAAPKDGGLRTAAFPGLEITDLLYPHQLQAVWRILSSGNTLLAHEVGAGKTLEMIIAAMEMRRTGRAQKPMITVPTHLLSQWKKAISGAYPTAKVLAFEETDLDAKGRRAAMARIAHGDWDIVLVPHSSFELLKSSPERLKAVLEEWVNEMLAVEAAMRDELGAKDPSVKQMAAARARIEDRVQRMVDKANKGEDNALHWEDLGVDALFVDEAHAFKNLFFFSKIDRIRGLSQSTADRSLDMYVKVKAINEASNYRNLIFATATPLMNSLAEAYTVQRYMQPHRLRELGFENFDNWYATFAHAKPVTERRANGTYEEVMRVAKFRNGKLLYRILSEIMDYVGWKDMPYLKLPKLKGGKVRIVKVDPHPMYPKVNDWFTERLAAIKATPPHWDPHRQEYIAPDRYHPITGERMMAADGSGWAKDNILTVMADAKMAAIDVRLVLGEHATDVPNSRLQQVTKEVADYLKAEQDNRGIALMFLDVGTPQKPEPLAFLEGAEGEDDKAAGALGVEDDTLASDPEDGDAASLAVADEGAFRMYDAIKASLIARGVKANEIAFIHQARNGPERLALFEALQQGVVRVLIASTDMGATGMNIQDRLGLIIDIDVPRAMRPGDIRQRLGRGIRANNRYADLGGLSAIRYVTTGTADEWLYDLLAKKEEMIQDFYQGEFDEGEDVDPEEFFRMLSEASLEAANDPRTRELLERKGALPRLQAQASSAERALADARGDAERYRRTIPPLQAARDRLAAWIGEHFEKIAGENFVMTIGRDLPDAGPVAQAQTFRARPEANAALIEALKPIAERALQIDPFRVSYGSKEPWQKVGDIGGLPILARPEAERHTQANNVVIAIDADAAGEGDITVGVIQVGAKGIGTGTFGEGRNLVASITDRYNGLEGRLAGVDNQLTQYTEQLAEREAFVKEGSDSAEKLAASKARIAQLEAELLRESAVRDAEAERARQEANLARQQQQGGGGQHHSEGDYADLPTTPGKASVTIDLNPMEFPEMVEIAKALQRTPVVVKRFRNPNTRGMFGAGGIRLAAKLFRKGMETQLAKTLTHEIGHLADWLPDHVLTRGNLIGHLRTLRKFMKGSYTAPDSTTITDKELRQELGALSMKWRPWDPATAGKSFAKYRKSADELYADAISALLNDPVLVQAEAPIFFKRFFEELDKKPDVRKAFFAVWSMMAGTREELVARREATVEKMFEAGNAKSVQILMGKLPARKLKWEALLDDPTKPANISAYLEALWEDITEHGKRVWWQGVMHGLVDKHSPFIRRLRQDRKEGKTLAPEDNPYFSLSERSYRISGQGKALMQGVIQPLINDMHRNNVSWTDFGKMLLYERIIFGDREELANPAPHTPAAARELRDTLRARLTPEQNASLRRNVDQFRGAMKAIAKQAWEEGLYTDETWEKINKNPAYVTFRTHGHLDDPISSRLHEQVGTLSDIEHVGESTLLKMLVTLNAIEHNRTKRLGFEYLEQHFPFDIADARMHKIEGKGRVPADPPKRSGLELVTFYVKGRQQGRYVDPEIARSLENESIGQNVMTMLGIQWVNNKYKSIYTTYNPGFQSFNLLKDFTRFYLNMSRKDRPRMTIPKALKLYWRSRHLAAVRAFGVASPESSRIRQGYRAVRSLIPFSENRPATAPNATELKAFKDLIQAEKAGILATSFSEHLGFDIDSQMLINIMRAVGVAAPSGGPNPDMSFLKRQRARFKSVRNVARAISDFNETLPKAAGMYEFKGEGEIADIPADKRHFIRTALGSPDFLAGGVLKPITNNVRLFSNAATQAWRADIDVATNPLTRSGYWWKYSATMVVPRLLMKAALLAAAGWLASAAGDDDDDEERNIIGKAMHAGTRAAERLLSHVPPLVWAGLILRKAASAYDLTNYLVLPIGMDKDGNGIAVRIAQPETQRAAGGFIWKGLEYFSGDADFYDFWRAFYGVLDYGAGQIPGEAPWITGIAGAVEYASGRNIRDRYRQKDLLTPDQQLGRPADTEYHALGRLLDWESQMIVGGMVKPFYAAGERPDQQTWLQEHLDWPVITNLAGRWVKVGQYGEVERNRKPGEKVASQAANQREKERRAISTLLPEYMNRPASEKNIATRMQYATEQGIKLAEQMYPKIDTREQQKARHEAVLRLRGKLSLSLLKGEADTLADPVLAASLTDQKVAILMGARRNYTPDQFEQWLYEAAMNGIISPQVMADVHQRMATVH